MTNKYFLRYKKYRHEKLPITYFNDDIYFYDEKPKIANPFADFVCLII